MFCSACLPPAADAVGRAAEVTGWLPAGPTLLEGLGPANLFMAPLWNPGCCCELPGKPTFPCEL